MQITENRDVPRLTGWLDKLTAHDLSQIDLNGITTIEQWLARLEAYGHAGDVLEGRAASRASFRAPTMSWGPWRAHFFSVNRACCGIDFTMTKPPTFFPGYRGEYQTMLKMMSLFNVERADGSEHYHTLDDTHNPADLMALSRRLQSAEDRGEIERLGLDPDRQPVPVFAMHRQCAAARPILRYAESKGGDDKITCAGSQQACNGFMELVAGVSR